MKLVMFDIWRPSWGHARGDKKPTKHSRPVICHNIYLLYLQWISSPSLVQLTYPFTSWRAEMKILLPNTLSLLAEHLCISRHSGWRQAKVKTVTWGRQEGRQRNKREERQDQGGEWAPSPRTAWGWAGSGEETQRAQLWKIKENNWKWMMTLQNWSNHSRQGCHILCVQRFLIFEDLLPVLFLQAFQNSTALTLEFAYIERSQSISGEIQNLIVL